MFGAQGCLGVLGLGPFRVSGVWGLGRRCWGRFWKSERRHLSELLAVETVKGVGVDPFQPLNPKTPSNPKILKSLSP